MTKVDSHLSGCDDVQVEVVTRVPLIAKRVATTLDIDCAISSVESARSNNNNNNNHNNNDDNNNNTNHHNNDNMNHNNNHKNNNHTIRQTLG